MQINLKKIPSSIVIMLLSDLLSYASLTMSAESEKSSSLTLKSITEWGGKKPNSQMKELHHPTQNVIICHTASKFCTSFETCSEKVQAIQRYHRGMGTVNIGYNFLIGGDANVYVGRGWDVQNIYSNDSISIAFIGNFVSDELTPDMITVTQSLISEGVKLGKLSENYKLINHNQTIATLSPGENVYKKVITWPHWSAGVFTHM